jgi:hypothetical protein
MEGSINFFVRPMHEKETPVFYSIREKKIQFFIRHTRKQAGLRIALPRLGVRCEVGEKRSCEGEPRSLQVLTNNAIQPRRHLRRHVVLATDDAGRQDRVVHVGGHEPRRRERLHLPPRPLGEQHLHERDAFVRVEVEERVVSALGRVRAARHGGEGQGLEPRGTALGRAREDHVAGARNEVPLDGHDPGHPGFQHPRALVAAQPHLGVAREGGDGAGVLFLLLVVVVSRARGEVGHGATEILERRRSDNARRGVVLAMLPAESRGVY